MRSLLSDGKTIWDRETGAIVHHVQSGDYVQFVGQPDLPCGRTLNRVPMPEVGMKSGGFPPVIIEEERLHPVLAVLLWASVIGLGLSLLGLVACSIVHLNK